MISLTADNSTCCCGNVNDVKECCWNGCKDPKELPKPVSLKCIQGVKQIGIKFAEVYWEKLNNETPEETHILMGQRIIEMIGKFYTSFKYFTYILYYSIYLE